MSALDQAFIKAYKQQGREKQPAPTGAAPAAPGPGNDPQRLEIQASAKLGDVMAALEKPSGKIADSGAVSVPPASGLERPSGKNEVDILAYVPPPAPKASKLRMTKKKKAAPAPTLDELDSAEMVYRLDPPSPTIPEPPRSSAFAAPPPCEKSAAESGPNAPLCQETTIRVFHPMLQVDHFAWPKVCHRIEAVAPAELDRLADTLTTAAKQGMKVVGISGAGRGEGTTTLLLCAARRLVSRCAKIAIVDADLAEPQLAKRLGLLPQLGWEDVATGRQPVEEVLIESIADNLAIMPLCNPLAVGDISCASQRLMAESLNTLRDNYDVVLLDLGPLENPRSIGDLTIGGLNCRIDAVIVVHKVGKVSAACLPVVRQSLVAAGMKVVGMIENFVQSPDINTCSQ